MASNKFKYYVDGDDFENAYEISLAFQYDDDEADDVAEECAEDYHGNHDGWEHSWPADFYIYSMEGKLLGVFEVDRQSTPVFYATEKKNAA